MAYFFRAAEELNRFLVFVPAPVLTAEDLPEETVFLSAAAGRAFPARTGDAGRETALERVAGAERALVPVRTDACGRGWGFEDMPFLAASTAMRFF